MHESTNRTMCRVAALAILLSVGNGETADSEVADTILFGGEIYTVDPERAWAEAVAVKDGLFVRVGSNQEIMNSAGESTELIDLDGAMVLPGLHDTHVHITGGAKVFAAGYCQIPDSFSGVSREGVYQAIKDCRDRNPDATGWFVGGGWPGSVFPPDGAPDKAFLDEVFPNRPVYLTADSYHLAWVNSTALELAGIDKDTPDPINGTIKRDLISGEATGTLFESAKNLVGKKIPLATEAEKDDALYRAMQYANSLGITSVFDAAVRESDLQSFTRLYESNRLPVHLRTAIAASADGDIKSADQILALAMKYENAGIKTRAVKVVLDGVMEGGTAAMIENYVGLNHAGELFVSPQVLTEALIELDAAGIQVKMHGYGRLAVREGLNAVETALKTNGQRGLRHHIDHSVLIHPDDYPRFAATGTVAGFSPYWAMPSSYEIDLTLPLLGRDRWMASYPIRSLQELGATVVSGSDWSVSSMNPFLAMATGVTRMDPLYPDRGPLNEKERVSLEDMIASYTINAAFVMHQEDVTGSIKVGKSADLIVLDRNIFEVSADELRETKVERTLFKGTTVVERRADSE